MLQKDKKVNTTYLLIWCNRKYIELSVKFLAKKLNVILIKALEQTTGL